ncbi:MAG: hypothetical protein QOI02_516 [Actinomycetota bacterium]|nr:hypothetical protein [Actinomycetota bacterium]
MSRPVPDRLRVVVASPLPQEYCDLIQQLEPRLEVVCDQSLFPRQRYPGDHSGDPSFERTPQQQADFEALVDSADALFGLPDENPQALARTVATNPKLRWVHTTPAGGGAQVRAATLPEEALGRIVFTQSGGIHAKPLAEFALLGLLAGAKHLGTLRAHQDRSQWADPFPTPLLSEQTVLVVGLGGIGKQVAAMLAALGVRVIGVHRRQVDAPGVESIVPVERLVDAVAEADGIVLTLPSTALTDRMLSREVLAAVRPGVTVVNVGRGSTIDEPALIEALGDGRVGFAALDVFASEPLASDSPLWSMPNVLVSPHVAARHAGEDKLIAQLFAQNATRLLDGEPLVNRVDTVEFY